MRVVATATATSTAAPWAFARRWAEHEQVGTDEWVEREQRMGIKVEVRYTAATSPDGTTLVGAQMRVGGLLGGLFAKVLGTPDDLPEHLRDEIAAVESGS